MHPETSETFDTVVGLENSNSQSPPLQHGNQSDVFGSPPNSLLGEAGGGQETGSEWSLSASPTPSEYDSGLNPIDAFLSEQALFEEDDDDDDEDDDGRPQSILRRHPDNRFASIRTIHGSDRESSPIQRCPQEILLHMLSHLQATDLLTVKLISRRFQALVNSPHVWIGAFSKHFPGSSTVSSSRRTNHNRPVYTTDKRAFTRLSPVASWTSEYLLRTKLLRCLSRGRPSLPFAAPSQGKPNKGFATFSFYSRLRSVTSLDAKFGPVNDKRLPQFIHACSDRGAVSMSDRRGELSGWGTTENFHPFHTFEEVYPGTAMWGEGRGEVAGVPNSMPVSATHGMICAEGYPGGHCFLMTSNDKFPAVVGGFLGEPHHDLGIPRLLRSSNSYCAAWISKTHAVPRQTQGLIGMLFGSSYGVISACSLGLPGARGQRIERGELTARWLLSPGVPVIAIHCDENVTSGRMARNRIWAVALNALGEVFYLRGSPKLSSRALDQTLSPELAEEARAWQTGRSFCWSLVRPSQRAHRPSYIEDEENPTYFPASVWPTVGSSAEAADLISIENWLYKSPSDIKARFCGWDMRQRLEVDFGGDDAIDDFGQSIFVFRCGHVDNIDDGERDLGVVCFTEHRNSRTASNADLPKSNAESQNLPDRSEWRTSQLMFGRSKPSKLTTTAIDSSMYATTTLEEDQTLWRTRVSQMEGVGKTHSSSPEIETPLSPKIPGQRARFIAAGTATGLVYIWNTRFAVAASLGVMHEVYPSRIVQTQSPEVSSIALSALYLVHGGSDGLVQAWDPLCSTAHPIRTICSAMSRRALSAAQQEANITSHNVSAVGAICLDPDPTLLRGIVALRGNLRYWSYSSASINRNNARSQKRRINRNPGAKSGMSDGFTGTRRVDLKGFVNQEMAERGMEERDKIAEQKRNKRINGRFGLDLLGTDASEEELIAYATLLSEEEQARQTLKLVEKKLPRDANEAEVEAHLNGLSGEDWERWKYASWEDRFDMAASEPSTVGRTTPTSASARHEHMYGDLAQAMKLNLEETHGVASATSGQESSRQVQRSVDDDMAEAIRRSLEPEINSPLTSSSERHDSIDEDEDLSKALRLSLQDQADSTSISMSHSGSRSHSLSAAESEDFPSLGESVSTPPSGAWSKGKRRV